MKSAYFYFGALLGRVLVLWSERQRRTRWAQDGRMHGESCLVMNSAVRSLGQKEGSSIERGSRRTDFDGSLGSRFKRFLICRKCCPFLPSRMFAGPIVGILGFHLVSPTPTAQKINRAASIKIIPSAMAACYLSTICWSKIHNSLIRKTHEISQNLLKLDSHWWVPWKLTYLQQVIRNIRHEGLHLSDPGRTGLECADELMGGRELETIQDQ